MGQIKRLIFIESGFMDYTDIEVDGHCGIFGPTSSGKTSVLRVLLCLLMTRKSDLEIGRQQQEFHKFYFQDENGNDISNAYIVFEMVNDLGGPYTIIVHKHLGDIVSEFVRSTYHKEWFFGEDGYVQDWDEVKLRIGGLWAETVHGMRGLNRRMRGVGKNYKAEFSYLHLKSSDDVFIALLSNVLRQHNGSVNYETIKDALVLAYLASQIASNDDNVDTELVPGVPLYSYIDGLRIFNEQRNDIRLMTGYVNGEKSSFSRTIDLLFGAIKSLDEAVSVRDSIPGLMKFAIKAQSAKMKTLQDSFNETNTKKTEEVAAKEVIINGINTKLSSLREERGQVVQFLSLIEEAHNKYASLPEGVEFSTLVNYCDTKSNIEDCLNRSKERLSTLTNKVSDLNSDEAREKQGIKDSYNKKISSMRKEYSDFRSSISKAFDERIKAATSLSDNAVMTLKQLLPEDSVSLLLSRYEDAARAGDGRTAAKLEEFLSDIDYLDSDVWTFLSYTSQGRSEKEWKNDLSELISLSNTNLEEITKKAGLLGKLITDLNSLSQRKSSFLDWLSLREENQENLLKQCLKIDLDKVIAEFDKMRTERLGEKNVKEIQKLRDKVALYQSQLDLVFHYPSASEDKKRYFDYEEIKKNRLIALNAEIKTKSSELDFALKELETYKETMNASLNTLRSSIDRYKNLSDAYDNYGEDFHEKVTNSIEIFTDEESSELWMNYQKSLQSIIDFQDQIKVQVHNLYSNQNPDKVLSSADTFDLGISIVREDGSFDNCYDFALRLRSRFESTGTDSFDSILNERSSHLYNFLASIRRSKSLIDVMINKVCSISRKATRFLNECNHTDCFSDMNVVIEPKNTDGLMFIFEDIRQFMESYGGNLGRNDLFSSDEVAKQAVDLLSRLSKEVLLFNENTEGQLWLYRDMFDLKFSYKENGIKKVSTEISSGESTSTLKLLRSFVNISFMRVFYEPGENTKIFLPMDEVNTMSPSNVPVLLDFAEKAGFYVVATGQTPPVYCYFDYVYGTSKYEGNNGVVYRRIRHLGNYERMARQRGDEKE